MLFDSPKNDDPLKKMHAIPTTVVVSSTECAPGTEASPSRNGGQEKGPKHYFSKWDLFTTPGRRPASEENENENGGSSSGRKGAAVGSDQHMPTPSPRLIDRITVPFS